MANVRNSDTSLWLHNKLGISNDSWTGGSICSQLNAEVLRNIKSCFPDLQTQVKLKLLLSVFHIPRRNVEEWRSELEDILEVAQGDSELWVSMLAEAMRTLPSTGSLNLEIGQNEENRRIFSDLVNDLRKLVKKQSDGGMLPLECHYLNKTALTTVVGQQPPPVKHFSLKRKPKSAALRAELLSKSQDAMSNLKKSTAPTVPVRSRGMPRKMTDTTPLKGIPSRVPTGGFRSPVLPSPNNSRAPLSRTPIGRKDGLIKLIDINEQPLGFAQAKKRKRMQELEEAQRATEAAVAAQSSVSPTSAGATGTTGTPAGLTSPPAVAAAPGTAPGAAPGTPSATPDYAIGLTALNPTSTAPATPTYGGPLTGTSNATIVTIQRNSPSTPTTPTTPLGDSLVVQSPSTPLQTPTLAVLTTSGLGAAQLVPVPIRQNRAVAAAVQAAAVQAAAAQAAAGAAAGQVPGGAPTTVPVAVSVAAASSLPVAGAGPGLVQPAAAPVAPPTAAPPRKRLSLTKEQMVEAQEMFSSANKVTRPEKALILGFMAGSRDNPCPNLGDIVTIKLNESLENVIGPDNKVVAHMVETHFQMNYSTGEWMRIKKSRKLEEQPPPSGAPTPAPQHATA